VISAKKNIKFKDKSLTTPKVWLGFYLFGLHAIKILTKIYLTSRQNQLNGKTDL